MMWFFSEETGIAIEHVGINTVPKNKVSAYDLEVEEDSSYYTTINFILNINSAAGSLISFALGITLISTLFHITDVFSVFKCRAC